MDEFQTFAERFRRALLCPTDQPGDQLVREASIEAGKALLRAEQAGQIELPRREWPDPDPALPHWEQAKEQDGLAQAAWQTFCFAAYLAFPSEIPSNPLAMRTLSETKQARGAMTSIEDWRSRAENFAQICDWLSRKLNANRHGTNNQVTPVDPPKSTPTPDTTPDTGKKIKRRKPNQLAIGCGIDFVANSKSDPTLSRAAFIRDWVTENGGSEASIERIFNDNPDLVDPAKVPTKSRHKKIANH